jgi:type IX secretion system PorP/SprF family membrane protein
MVRQLWFLFVLSIILLPDLQAQDPIYSQFYAAPLQINPAFAGTTLAPRISLNYRNQWAAYEGGYETYSVSYEQSVEGLNSGFGFMLLSDDAGNGIYKTNRFTSTYGYRLKINDDWAIRLGIEAGLIQNRLDWDRLVFLDQIDPINGPTGSTGMPNPSQEIAPESLNNTLFDVGTGILVYGKKAYAGLALHHLNTADESLLEINQNLGAGLPMRFTIHGGTEISLQKSNIRGQDAFISPNLLFVKQGPFAQVNAGSYFGMGSFFGGLWYRHTFNNPDAFMVLAGVRYGVFRFGYSYDFTLNGLTLARTNGAHELSLTINFENSEEAKRRRRSADFNNCFKMFN